MKKTTLLKSMLLLCALVVGSGSLWAQGDKSAVYTSNVTLSATGGTKATASTVVINSTDYNAMKLGSNGNSGSFKVTFPVGTKYIHLHAAAWNGKNSNTLSFTGITTDNITLTPNTGISGTSSTYTFATDGTNSSPNSTNHYKVITLTTALASATEVTLTCSERCVIWGVNSEAESSTFNVTYNANGATSGTVPVDDTDYNKDATVTVLGNTGSLAKTYCTFGGWNTKADGTGTNYSAGNTFSITSNTTLYAKWNDTRSSAGLAWSAASADVTYGADNVFPTLTNTHDVTVTYSSSNQAAATINETTGVITLKDYTGSTTISAIFAGDDDYLPQTVTYTLNVSKAPFSVKDGIFDFVEAADAGEDYGSGVTTTSTSSEYVTTNKTWVAGNVTMVTSKESGSGYRWWSADGTLRFYNGSKATFSVPSGYVITKIVTTGASFDSASPTGLSGFTWTGASNEVELSVTATRNIKTITVTYTTENQSITPAKQYTTLTSAYNLNFTGIEGLKAYIATSVSDKKVQMTQVNKVPAGTGLVLKATTPNSPVDVPVFDGTGAEDMTGNQMVGSATTTTAIAENGGYILKDGVFQPATAGTLAAGKAYLAIAVSAHALELDFGNGNVTSINKVEAAKQNAGVYYNLAGQRVAQPTKGLYIVNGKKVVLK